MTIIVTLSPELETLLRDRAELQEQDVSFVASELLANILEWDEQDSASPNYAIDSLIGNLSIN